MRRTLSVAVVLVTSIAVSVTVAQEPQVPAGATFEVVSIKRNTSAPNGMSVGCRVGGRWLMVNGTIESLVGFAYPSDNGILGSPDWVTLDRYDVDARASDNASCDEMRPMMQALLAERFKLLAHYESREEDVFALVLARSDGQLGPQIRRSDLDCDAILAARREGKPVEVTPPANGAPACGTSAGPDGLRFAGVTVARLGFSIRQSAGRIVIDKTGLDGLFDFSLVYAGERALATGNAGDRPGLFTALQEQLGLKLQPDKAVLRSLVIDSIERPTEN